MKYVIIGASGHHHQATDAAKAGLCPMPAAVAPASPGENARALAAATGAAYYEDYREMLGAERPDVAVVNPWYGQNAPVSIQCLQRGLHVYCEKPLATTLSQLADLRRAWAQSGKALGSMLNLNCCGWFKAVKSAVAAGEIGDVRMIHGQKSYRMGTRGALYQRREDYGGTIPWVAIHAIDWVLALGGACLWVSAAQSRVSNGGNGEMEATSALLMGLENGVIGTVTADFLRPDASARHDDDRLRVTGTRGMLEAVDGHVYLENHLPKRALEIPPDENAFMRFLNAISTPEAAKLAEEALADTLVSLLARQAGDENRVIPVPEA